MSHDDPESWHAKSPSSAHTESRWMLGAPHAPHAPRGKLRNRPHHTRFFTHRWIFSPTGGSDYPPAVAHRAFWLISGFFVATGLGP